MQIGIPKEIKNGEHRVALTPQAVAELTKAGHKLRVQYGAGIDSGYPDADYQHAGAILVRDAADAWACDLVVKVKEPLAEEFTFLNPDSSLFTFLHLAVFPELTQELLSRKVCAIGYETVQREDGVLPILAPMSKVAGRVAMLMAARFLQFGSFHGQILEHTRHKGILMGGIKGVEACRVMIVGGGNVGLDAARVAVGLDAQVMVLDQREETVARINREFDGRVQARLCVQSDMDEILSEADVVIGAALIPGEHAPRLISREMIDHMQNGSVIMDVAIDQGGISETSRVTSYDKPVYTVDGVIHSCLPNLPAAVPRSSSQALVAATLPYLKILAEQGVENAIETNAQLRRGVNTLNGEIMHSGVLKAFHRMS